MERFEHNLNTGLTEEQVSIRMKEKLYNYDTSIPTKTIPQIIRDNCFTLFNLLNLALAFFVFWVGSYKNLLFLGVVICNTLISTIQEVRSKKIVDKLSILSSSKANVLRNGVFKKVGVHDIVLDDIIAYELGNQVMVDSILLSGECEVNEAFITGEADPILKKRGDTILSGSFLVSGSCMAYVDHIGNDNYTSRISSGAKYVKKLDSEMMVSLKKLIKIISILIVPLGLLLFYHQLTLTGYDYHDSILHTVAALIGMIPEGLILLTSTVLAVSVIRLSKYKVLVQELYCIETLAYVDVLCLDKTGTITEGNMEVEKIVPISVSEKEFEKEISTYVSLMNDKNSTARALKEKFSTSSNEKLIAYHPFSSFRKWSGMEIEKKGSYVLGAPEKVLKKEELKYVQEYENGYRVLAFCHSSNFFQGKMLPNDLKLIGIVLLSDKIRSTAKKTLSYFKKQGTEIKLISGDSVHTVESIARKVGIPGSSIDASLLKTKEEVLDACEKYSIFARVSPDMKKDIVCALKQKGHKVAMTGDGVNDVLALKEADCSIAMNSGSDAARNVSQLVLLDSNFDAMPKVLEEGRRTINNIERSASLFLIKTIYASILAVCFALLPFEYPFEPIQMSLTSMFTIGIPSFVLALEPNYDLVKGNFLKNVLKKAAPTAIAIVIHILLIAFLSSVLHLTSSVSSTLCVFIVGYLGFLHLYHLCIPFNSLRKILYFFLVTGYLLCFVFFKDLYSLAPINLSMVFYMLLLLFLGFLIFEFNYYIYSKWFSKK